MDRELQVVGDFFIPIDAYRQYLAISPYGSRHDLRTHLGGVPVWLNDYYVATAMEALARKGRLVKGTRYIQDYNWPPKEAGYLFRHKAFMTSSSVATEARRIETDSKCMAYQRHLMIYTANTESCFVGARFESEGYSQTISRREVSHGVRMKLNEGAPPCERCWELNEQKMGLSELVVQFLKTELAEAVEPFSAIKEEYQGNDSIRPSYPNGWRPRTFLGTVVEHCVDTGIGYEEIKPALEITRRAVAIHARHCKGQTDEQVNTDELKRELQEQPP